LAYLKLKRGFKENKKTPSLLKSGAGKEKKWSPSKLI